VVTMACCMLKAKVLSGYFWGEVVATVVRCMLNAKVLSGYFWGEVVATVVHILNRSLTRVVAGKALYEVWHGVPLVVHYLQTFSYLAHIEDTRSGLKKLDDRSRRTIFVSYEAGSKAYHCYDHVGQCIIISRDVVFDEAEKWCWESSADTNPFTVEYRTELVHAPAPAPATPSPSSILAPPSV
jgi:hypothetical protein